MAAVTVNTWYPKANVIGSYREYYYNIDIAADADYLDVPLKVIRGVNLTDDSLTAVGVASIALNTGGLTSRITFNAGGAINDCFVRVVGL